MNLFIIGLVFGCFIYPILSSLCDLVLQFIEIFKALCVRKIQKISKPEEQHEIRVLGFTPPEESEASDIDI